MVCTCCCSGTGRLETGLSEAEGRDQLRSAFDDAGGGGDGEDLRFLEPRELRCSEGEEWSDLRRRLQLLLFLKSRTSGKKNTIQTEKGAFK